MRDRRGRKPGEQIIVKRQKTTQSPEYPAITNELRAWRKVADLTQGELAPLIKEIQSWVSRVESGNRRIDRVEQERFINACKAHIAARDQAMSPATPTVAGGASSTLPAGMELPLLADRPVRSPEAERAEIARRMRAVRKAARLKPPELAQRLGKLPAWVLDVERGRHHADGYEITRWLEACGLDDPNLILQPRPRQSQ